MVYRLTLGELDYIAPELSGVQRQNTVNQYNVQERKIKVRFFDGCLHH